MSDRASAGAAGLSPENAITLDRLVHSIDMAEGFTLFFARCNVPALRSELIDAAVERLAGLGVELVEVAFEDEPANVRGRLRSALLAANAPGTSESAWHVPEAAPDLVAIAEAPPTYGASPKRAVFVTGLEYGIPYDQPNTRILAELNLGRDLFPRDAPHSLVIWLPDYAVTAVAHYAPDFWAWRSGVFEFETSEAERSADLEQFTGDRPWSVLTNLTPEARLLRRRQLESLLDDYRNLPDDPRVTRERANILSDLGNVCATSQDHSQAIAYYQRALELYRQVGDRRGEATTHNNIGLVYSALWEKRKALAYYEQALLLQRQVGDRGGEATTLNNIGLVYSALGDKRQALAYYEQALELTWQVGNPGGEAATLNNIGGVYFALGEKRKALDYYEQALPLRRQVGDRGGEATTLNNIGMVYFALGKKREALAYFEQALELTRQVGDREGEARTLTNIGGVHSDLGEKGKALAYFEQALPLRRQVGDRWGESITRFNIGMVYEALGDLAKAEEQLAIVVALDEAVGHPDLANDRAALERIQAKRKAGSGKR